MPNARYDWEPYIPRMIELYKTSMSIPQIHDAIQDPDNGFSPKKFREAGFSTNQEKRAELLRRLDIASWPQIVIDKKHGQPSFLPTKSPVSTNETERFASESSTSNTPPCSFQKFGTIPLKNAAHQLESSQIRASNPETVETSFSAIGELTLPLSNGHGGESFSSSMDPRSQPFIPVEGQDEMCWGLAGAYEHQDFSMEYPPGFFDTPTLSPSQICNRNLEGDLTQPSRVLHCPESLPRVSQELIIPDRTLMSVSNDWAPSDSSLPPKPTLPIALNSSPPTRTRHFAGGVNRVIARCLSPRQRSNRSFTSEDRYSTSTLDSGYVSGTSTQFSLRSDIDPPQPQPLNEFEGLHRVPCHNPHEPHPMKGFKPYSETRYKDRLTCLFCQYSGIHNLSWFSRHLKLEVFTAELQFQEVKEMEAVYDVDAVDAVGNTALHYAAAGGANYERIKALIDAGVNPHRINTAGQLYSHCLRPLIGNIEPQRYDKDLTRFEVDFIRLLKICLPKGALTWRDNAGSTALDALARRIKLIKDQGRKAYVFRLAASAGYPLEMSNQSQKIFNMSMQTPACEDIASPNKVNASGQSSFEATQIKQSKAWEIFGRAKSEPSYIDPETGDNILHALSRLRMSQTRELINNIQEFASKHVIDLNLYNRDRDCPLAAFIHERPFNGVDGDETGATLSKYLDALLWKDKRAGIPNRINVNLKNREGATALYYAAIRGRPDSVRSLIDAGANVNLRVDVDGRKVSILKATLNAKAVAVAKQDDLKIHLLDNVISYLKHENAVVEPTILEERGLFANSVLSMPM